MSGYRVSWQDWTDHQFGGSKPKPATQDFPSRGAAEDFKRQLLLGAGDGLIATITPITHKQRINRWPEPSNLLPQFQDGMRLTR